MIRPGVRRLFRLSRRGGDAAEREMDEEIRHHLEEREAQLVARGVPVETARAEALRRFGDLDAARTRLARSASRRDERLALRERITTALHDVRVAWRALRRAPGFLLVAVSCLALGIGANAAVFSVADAVLLRPLPFTDADRLVRVWDGGFVPLGIMERVRAESRAYVGVAGYEGGSPVSLVGSGEPIRAVAARTTDNFFGVLGVSPALGRAFTAADSDPGGAPVTVISHALWQDRFGGDSGAIGTRLSLDGVAYTIVGVMPERFRFPSGAVALWTPVREARGTPGYWWMTYFQIIGRLAPGMTPERAAAESRVVIDRSRSAFPMRMPDDWGRDVDVRPLQDALTGGSRGLLVLLLGAVAMVLLVACTNVATLSIARAGTRARELGVRAALGAGRGRIVRLLLVESAIVGALGTAAGLAIAAIGVRLLVTRLPAGTPRVDEIALDWRATLFAAVLMLFGTVLFGLLPALRATRLDLVSALKSSSGTRPGRWFGGTSLLVASQLALAVVLVTGAGLLLKSLWTLRGTDVGFRTADVLTTEIPLPSFPADSSARAPIFFESVLERVRALPGVQAAAVTSTAPFGDGAPFFAMAVEAHPTPEGGVPPTPVVSAVSDGYFRTLDIGLVRGRLLQASDRDGTARVAVIDVAAARALWPTEDPIGQRIRYVWDKEWITVVGIVRNVKRDSLSSVIAPSLYIPLRQGFARGMRLLVHTAAQGAPGGDAIRAAIRAADPTVPTGVVRPFSDLVSDSAARSTFVATLLSLFAGVALLLGAIGIYGVMSSSVVRRTREIGVRLAVGATRAQVLRMILRQSAGIAMLGVAVGLAGALAGGRLLERFLYGVTPHDTMILALVPLVLGVVTVLAALAPARRAARVDPMVTIRAE